MPPINEENIENVVEWNSTVSTDMLEWQARRLQDTIEHISIMNRSFKKTPKEKTIMKQLDDISKDNSNIFINVKKLQNEIDILEKKNLEELMDKYKQDLFLLIGRQYYESKRKGNISLLQQMLIPTINSNIMRDILPVDEFKTRAFSYVQRYVVLDDTTIPSLSKCFDDVYDYYVAIYNKKKEKKSLMGLEEKKNLVCEDYLNKSQINNSNGLIFRTNF